MSFESFKSIADVIAEYQITAIEKPFVQPLFIEIDPTFQDRLDRHLTEFNVKDSEYAACEMIIFPILAEVCYHHRQKFVLWSHKAPNGEIWQFGNLTHHTFIQDRKSYTLDYLDDLMAAVSFLF